MSVRTMGQLSLADALAVCGGRENKTLERLRRLIDWPRIAALVAPLRASSYGAPGYPPLVMLKALLLQQWYGLSDPGLEEALADRLSFRRFVGLALDEASPDHSTISRFRTALGAAGLSKAVFEEVTRQIDGRGLILRQGTLIDATLVEAHVKRPKKPKEDEARAVEPAGEPVPAAGAPGEAAAEPAAPRPARPPEGPPGRWA